MKRRWDRLRCAVGLGVLLAAGCAGSTKFFTALPGVPAGQSNIVVYRIKRLRAGDAYPHIYLDGEKRFPLRNATYNVLSVRPGKHVVEARGSILSWGLPPEAREVDVQPGETAFLKLYVEPGVFRDNVVFEPADQEAALSVLPALRLSR